MTTDTEFHKLLDAEYASAHHSDTLQRLRNQSWNHYLQLGLPTRKTEQYRYIKLRNLLHGHYTFRPQPIQKDITPHILPECQHSVIVIVNGQYSPQLSTFPDDVVITPLTDATKTYGAFLNNQWSQSLKSERDPFATVNAALHSKGIFIYIPPQCVLDTSIEILHIIDTGTAPALLQPRLHFYAGKNAHCSLIFKTIALDSTQYGINQVAELTLDENAHVTVSQTSGDDHGWHLDAVRATLKRSSVLKTVCLTTGSPTTRHDYHITLSGEHAEAHLYGLCRLQEKREAHTHVFVDHQAPHCRSKQLFKGVCNDASRSSFEGKIYIHQQAQKTEAYQRNSNLILDERAKVYSKPNLEIFADDVKASHGSTIGQLDEEQIFYLKTRGLADAEAKRLLIEGFCKEITDLKGIA